MSFENDIPVAVRVMRSRLGGLELAARMDPREYTKAARQTFLDGFERQVDPTGELPVHERERRATAARKAYFTRLALASSQARRRRRKNTTERES